MFRFLTVNSKMKKKWFWDLNESAKTDKNAAKAVALLTKKSMQKPLNIEYEGSIRDLARKPKQVIDKAGNPVEPDNVYRARVDAQKRKQVWRDLNALNGEDSDE